MKAETTQAPTKEQPKLANMRDQTHASPKEEGWGNGGQEVRDTTELSAQLLGCPIGH